MIWKIAKKEFLPRWADSKMSPSLSNLLLGTKNVPHSLERNVWMAWQFNQPETGEGLVQAFRRGDSNFFGCRLKLRGLQPDARYEITNFDIPGKTCHWAR